ncbi:hypothetical protein [Sphingobium bisphenolivorans]|uniref:hypothetical protein n=1 Tax=Sphingobium bisphenolivorans TaxID=1335760 RepID=UPI0003A574E9|nr:hypothetical protein [Sphingobium bisphenolivorans]
MIDLSPHPRDSGGGETAPVAPQHDPITPDPAHTSSRWSNRFSHERAERAVQLVSRWAGPFALLATLILIGWIVIY